MIRDVIENPEFPNQLLERIPLGRIADPKDVVGPVMFFCSRASAFVTEQIMYVDGGLQGVSESTDYTISSVGRAFPWRLRGHWTVQGSAEPGV